MRKALLVLPLSLFFITTSFAQSRLGLGSSLYNSEYVPSLHYELELHKDFSISIRGSYFQNSDSWYGLEVETIVDQFLTIESTQRSKGYGIGIGIIRNNFLVNNLFFDVHLDYGNRETKWLSPNYYWWGAPAFRFEPQANVKFLNPSFGLGYELSLTDQLFIKAFASYGKEIMLTEIEQIGNRSPIELEDRVTKTFGVVVGTSF